MPLTLPVKKAIAIGACVVSSGLLYLQFARPRLRARKYHNREMEAQHLIKLRQDKIASTSGS